MVVMNYRNFFKKVPKSWPIVALILITLLGIYLRLRQISSTDLWYDEAFTGIAVKSSWTEMFKIVAQDRLHPPLFYILEKICTSILGNTPFTLRLLPLIFGAAAIPLAYYFFKVFEGESIKAKTIGLVAAMVVAISPFFVTYSVEARSYTLVAFLTLASCIFFIRAINNKDKGINADWVAWAILVILTVFTHYIMLLLPVAFLLAFIFKKIIDKKLFYNSKFWTNTVIILTLSLITLIAILKFTGLTAKLTDSNVGWIPKANFCDMAQATYAFLFGAARQSEFRPPVNNFILPISPLTIGSIILLIAIIGGVVLIKKYEKKPNEIFKLCFLFSLSLAPILGIILISEFGLYMFVERYLIGFGLIELLLLTYIFANIAEKKLLIIAAVYALSLLAIIYPQTITKYHMLADQINAINESSITFQQPTDFVVMKYYLWDKRENMHVLVEQDGKNYDKWALISREEELAGTWAIGKNGLYISDGPLYSSDFDFLNKIDNYYIYRKF